MINSIVRLNIGRTRWRVRLLICALPAVNPMIAQARPTPPMRDPNTPGYVAAKELPDGTVPPSDTDGNFVIGPTHTPALEMVVHEGVPRGTVHTFTMRSADRKLFPGLAPAYVTVGPPIPHIP